MTADGSGSFGVGTPARLAVTWTHRRDPRVVATLLRRARLEMALGDLPAAVALLTQAVRYDPTAAPAWVLKGRCHCLLGDEADTVHALGVLADLAVPHPTAVGAPDARAVTDLRRTALQTFHSAVLADARRLLRRRAPVAAGRALRAVPDVLHDDEQFRGIRTYAHDRVPWQRAWRLVRRRGPTRPLDGAALQSVLEWLFADELAQVSDVVDQTDPPAGGTRLRAAEEVVLTAERIDDRCARMAVLHSAIELGLAEWFCATAAPPGFDGVDDRIAAAAGWAAAAIEHGGPAAATEALAERITAMQLHLSRTRALFGCRTALNGLVARYRDRPIRDEGELERAKGLFSAVHAEATAVFGAQPVDARNRALIAEIRATAARHQERLQVSQ